MNSPAYTWHVEGKPISISLNLEVVDRLAQEALRGLGAVPKRGAEVGGILIGSIERTGETLLVNVTDYILIATEYKRGPSYLLSENDRATFKETVAEAKKDKEKYPVGFFRTNTRENVGLAEEDLELLASDFPEPWSIALMIRPYATRVSTAAFYFKEDGKFQSGPGLLDFPFRSRELNPEWTEARPRNTQRERRREAEAERLENAAATSDAQPSVPSQSLSIQRPIAPASAVPSAVISQAVPAAVDTARQTRAGWVWIALSLVLLLLGILLGYETTLVFHPPSGAGVEDFGLALVANPSGDNLHVKWDRDAPAIRKSQRGVLTITDGGYGKDVQLDGSQLQNGSVVYRHSSSNVRFRLEVFTGPRTSVTETIDWKSP